MSASLKPEVLKPRSERECVECSWCSVWGRCQKALSLRYSSLVIGKKACKEFKDGLK